MAPLASQVDRTSSGKVSDAQEQCRMRAVLDMSMSVSRTLA